MSRLAACSLLVLSLARFAHSQTKSTFSDDTAVPPFEIYGLASAMGTVDATGTMVVNNPTPNQPFGFTPSGLAAGARTGFVWRHENIGLVADLGFHKFSDHTGTTTLAPLIAGLRVYSDEHFRTAIYGDFLAGAYRWTMHSDSLNFTHVKGIAGVGGGMDIRLTRRMVFRLFEAQVLLAGSQNGPMLTGTASSGIAYRFGGS